MADEYTDPVERMREASVALSEAAHDLAGLYGPIWHEREGLRRAAEQPIVACEPDETLGARERDGVYAPEGEQVRMMGVDGTAAAMLAEFHSHPNCAPEQTDLRRTLHREEHRELEAELEAEWPDRSKIARELADVVYVAYGTALVHRIDLGAALREIHRAAMTKLDANVRRADGKVLKPPGFVPPDMTRALR